MKKRAKKVKKSKPEVKIVKTKEKVVKRKVELSPSNKNVLWLLSADERSASEIRNELNLSREKVENELEKLLGHGLIFEKGRILKRYGLTNQGSKLLGRVKMRLDARMNMNKIKSGKHVTLTIVSKNIGDKPIEDTILKITSPRFLTIARQDSSYSKDGESFILELPIEGLNPRESQVKMFNLHGKLTEGTITSRYNILVEAITGDKVADRKELTLTVEK